jgi:hypothetical protein
MGKSAMKKTANKYKSAKKDRVTKKTGIVDKYRLLTKAIIAAYPYPDGSPFHTGKVDEKSFFRRGHFMKQWLKNGTEHEHAKANSEFVSRPGMALCLAACAIDMNSRTLLDKKFLDAAKTLQDRSGVPPLIDLLKSETGKNFLQAMKILNAGTARRCSEREATDAIATCVDFIEEHSSELYKHLPRMASFAGKVLQFACNFFELTEILGHGEKLAEKLAGVKGGPAFKRWMKDSSNTRKLVAAFAEQFYEKVKNNKPQKVNRSAADSSSEGDGTVVASDDEDANESEDEPTEGSISADSESDNDGDEGSEDSSDDKKTAKKTVKKTVKKTDKKSAQKRGGKAADKSRKKDDGRKSKNHDKEKRAAPAETAEATDAKEAAFTQWTLGDSQKAGAKAATFAATGEYDLASLKEFLEALPHVIRKYAHIDEFFEGLKSRTDVPKLAEVRRHLLQLAQVSDAAEEWYTSQQSAAGTSGSAEQKDEYR